MEDSIWDQSSGGNKNLFIITSCPTALDSCTQYVRIYTGGCTAIGFISCASLHGELR